MVMSAEMTGIEGGTAERSLRRSSRSNKMSPATTQSYASTNEAKKNASTKPNAKLVTPDQPLRQLRSQTETLSVRRSRRINRDVQETPVQSLRAVKTTQARGSANISSSNSVERLKSKSAQPSRRAKQCRDPSPPRELITCPSQSTPTQQSGSENMAPVVFTPPAGFMDTPGEDKNRSILVDSNPRKTRHSKRRNDTRLSSETITKTPKLVAPRLTGQTYSIPQKSKSVRKVPDAEKADLEPHVEKNVLPNDSHNSPSSQGKNDSFLHAVITKAGDVKGNVPELETKVGTLDGKVCSGAVGTDAARTSACRDSCLKEDEVDRKESQSSHNSGECVEESGILTDATERHEQEVVLCGSHSQESPPPSSQEAAVQKAGPQSIDSQQTHSMDIKGSVESVTDEGSSQMSTQPTSSQGTCSLELLSQETNSSEVLSQEAPMRGDICDAEASKRASLKEPIAGSEDHLKSGASSQGVEHGDVCTHGQNLVSGGTREETLGHTDTQDGSEETVRPDCAEVDIEAGISGLKPPVPKQKARSPASLEAFDTKKKKRKEVNRRRSSFIQDRISRPLLTPTKSFRETTPDVTPEEHLAGILEAATQQTLDQMQTDFPEILQDPLKKSQVLEHVSRVVSEMKRDGTLTFATSVAESGEAITKRQAVKETFSARWQAEREAWETLVSRCEAEALQAERIANEADDNPITEAPAGFDEKSLRLINCESIRQNVADVKKDILFMVHKMVDAMKEVNAATERAEGYIAEQSQRLCETAIPEKSQDPKLLVEHLLNTKNGLVSDW